MCLKYSKTDTACEGAPRRAERQSLFSVSCVLPWASSQWDMPGTPLRGGVHETPKTAPAIPLAPLDPPSSHRPHIMSTGALPFWLSSALPRQTWT